MASYTTPWDTIRIPDQKINWIDDLLQWNTSSRRLPRHYS